MSITATGGTIQTFTSGSPSINYKSHTFTLEADVSLETYIFEIVTFAVTDSIEVQLIAVGSNAEDSSNDEGVLHRTAITLNTGSYTIAELFDQTGDLIHREVETTKLLTQAEKAVVVLYQID